MACGSDPRCIPDAGGLYKKTLWAVPAYCNQSVGIDLGGVLEVTLDRQGVTLDELLMI